MKKTQDTTLSKENNKPLSKIRKSCNLYIRMIMRILKEIKDEQVPVLALRAFTTLVHLQKESESINGVIDDQDEQVDLTEIDMVDQLPNIRIVGNQNRKAQAYVIVVTKKGFGELIKD